MQLRLNANVYGELEDAETGALVADFRDGDLSYIEPIIAAVNERDGLLSVLDDYAAERIRADQLWDIAHALQAALSRLMDSQRGLNLAEWQAATAQGRAALDKANEAETEAE